jgi:hypothetical protein
LQSAFPQNRLPSPLCGAVPLALQRRRQAQAAIAVIGVVGVAGLVELIEQNGLVEVAGLLGELVGVEPAFERAGADDDFIALRAVNLQLRRGDAGGEREAQGKEEGAHAMLRVRTFCW